MCLLRYELEPPIYASFHTGNVLKLLDETIATDVRNELFADMDDASSRKRFIYEISFLPVHCFLLNDKQTKMITWEP